MTVTDELDELLDEEREALLSGNLEKIGRLLERKESLIDELSVVQRLEHEPLQHLKIKLKRNQELLDQALEGIRTVANRLATLRRVRQTLDTYDAKGAKRSIAMSKDSSVEKRA
ncbi:MAG: flagellar biosynthesis protein FlgN [Roseobacter sp.]|jgi:flagellar biosynthesis/type III secretory pathway chaperone